MRLFRIIYMAGLILAFSLEGCVPAGESLQGSPATTPTDRSASTAVIILPTASPTEETAAKPVSTAAGTPLLAATFPADIYPPPLPFLQPVNGIEAAGCPDLTAVEPLSGLPAQAALDTLNALRSEDPLAFRQASDQTFWDAIQFQEEYKESDLTIQPAAQSPYSSLVLTGCGQKTLNLSWWVQAGSGALATHYFLINRLGCWLVWASYP
jgi:hypothetical protein